MDFFKQRGADGGGRPAGGLARLSAPAFCAKRGRSAVGGAATAAACVAVALCSFAPCAT